jgi:hypothetical protein
MNWLRLRNHSLKWSFLALPILVGTSLAPALSAPDPYPIPAKDELPSSDEILATLVVGPKCEKGEETEVTGHVEISGVRISARPLPTTEWELWLEKQVPGMGHMLRPHDGGLPPFQVFLVSIENLSDQKVRFQPGNVLRLFDKPDLQDHARDYTDLYRYLTSENKNADALAKIQDTFYDTAITLESGSSVSRLLFFHPLPVDKKWKTVSLFISHFQIGTETVTTAIPYHREKKNKKGK